MILALVLTKTLYSIISATASQIRNSTYKIKSPSIDQRAKNIPKIHKLRPLCAPLKQQRRLPKHIKGNLKTIAYEKTCESMATKKENEDKSVNCRHRRNGFASEYIKPCHPTYNPKDFSNFWISFKKIQVIMT
jgi:hypothetical protein